MERAARPLRGALLVERVGDGERVGVALDDRVERRALRVDGVDAGEVRRDGGVARDRAARELGRELRETDLDDVQEWCARGRRRGRHFERRGDRARRGGVQASGPATGDHCDHDPPRRMR